MGGGCGIDWRVMKILGYIEGVRLKSAFMCIIYNMNGRVLSNTQSISEVILKIPCVKKKNHNNIVSWNTNVYFNTFQGTNCIIQKDFQQNYSTQLRILGFSPPK